MKSVIDLRRCCTRGNLSQRNYWAFLAAGDDRSFAGNDGYDDEPAKHYRWDSTVANHGRISVGDVIVLWNKSGSIGASIVESIELSDTTKNAHRCPFCGKSNIKKRVTKAPLYRCNKCKATFDRPETRVVDVVAYTSTHSRSWIPLWEVLDAPAMRSCCQSTKSQLSLRPLDWSKFEKALWEKGLRVDFGRIASVDMS